MYPAPFDYVATESLDEALAVLAERGDEAKVLAGGQSLIPLLKLRFASPEVLVDINRIAGLDTLAEDGGTLRIGALVRHKTCERSQLLRDRYRSAGRRRRRSPIRSSATSARSAARSRTRTRRATGLRCWRRVRRSLHAARKASARCRISGFFQGPFTTALDPAEIVTEIRVPDPGPRSGAPISSSSAASATLRPSPSACSSASTTARWPGRRRAGVGATGIRRSRRRRRSPAATLDDEASTSAADSRRRSGPSRTISVAASSTSATSSRSSPNRRCVRSAEAAGG